MFAHPWNFQWIQNWAVFSCPKSIRVRHAKCMSPLWFSRKRKRFREVEFACSLRNNPGWISVRFDEKLSHSWDCWYWQLQYSAERWRLGCGHRKPGGGITQPSLHLLAEYCISRQKTHILGTLLKPKFRPINISAEIPYFGQKRLFWQMTLYWNVRPKSAETRYFCRI